MCDLCKKLQPQIELLTKRHHTRLQAFYSSTTEPHDFKALLLKLLVKGDQGDQVALHGAAAIIRLWNSYALALADVVQLREVVALMDEPMTVADQAAEQVANLSGEQLQIVVDGLRMLTGWTPQPLAVPDVSRETLQAHDNLTHDLSSLLWAAGFDGGVSDEEGQA